MKDVKFKLIINHSTLNIEKDNARLLLFNNVVIINDHLLNSVKITCYLCFGIYGQINRRIFSNIFISNGKLFD